MRVSITMLFLLLVIEAVAQTIHGRVLDEDDMPIVYANVILLTPDSVFIDGMVTSDKGDFVFHSVPTKGGEYRLKISCIGYELYDQIFKGDSLGIIRLNSQTNLLSEVMVTPPEYKMRGNGLVVNIQNSSLRHLEDVGKMLEFIPGLQYNNDGLYVFGKGKPIVYLNGRILSDMTELERLKSSDIATIEIIKNPGAAYSSSSQAVVKIKTIRKKGEGLSVDLKSYFQLAHRTRFGETVQTNYRLEKLDIFVYLNYLKANDYETEKSRYDIKSIDPFSLNNMQKRYINRNRYNCKAGFDYYFTKRQNIGAYYSLIYNDISGNSKEDVIIDGNDHAADKQNYIDVNGLTSPAHRINAYYDGHIGSVDISFNNDFYTSNEKQSQMIDGESEMHGVQKAVTRNNLKNSLVASDLSLRYKTGKSVWEIGMAYNHVHRANDYHSTGGVELTEYQKIQEDKMAAYANCQLSWDKWEVSAGLRYEHYRYDYYKNDKHIAGQSKLYKNVYPALNVFHPVGNVDVSLSYSIKSRKPPYNALDGNVQYISRNLYRGGNPLLKPSTIHDLQLSMLYKGLTVFADYMRINNQLYYTYCFYNDEQTVILSSYDNYPKVNLFQVQASYSKRIGVWKPQFSVDFLKGNYKFEQDGRIYRQDAPLVSFNFNHIFTLPRQWYIYLYTLYQTKGCNEEGLRLSDKGRVSLYVVKKWKNFSVDVLFNDIFRTYKDTYSAISSVCSLRTSGYFDTRNIQINIRYHFNASRSKYRGTDAAAEELNRM